MNTFRFAPYLVALSVAAPWSAVSLADAVEAALPGDLRVCASKPDDKDRLSCFDREIARLDREAGTEQAASVETAPAAPVSVAAATAAASPAPVAEAGFGYRGDIAREELDRREAQTPKIDRLTAKVSELSAQPRGHILITLDNGQVWVQKTPDPKLRLKVGDEVTIRSGALGSFLLSGPRGRSTYVKRQQ